MNFEKELSYAKAVIPDPTRALYNARKNIEIIDDYVEKLKEHFDVTKENFRQIINEYLNNLLQNYATVGSTKLLQKQAAAFNFLSNNSQKLRELYRKIKDENLSEFDLEKEKWRYNGNHDECIKLAVEDAIYTLRESKKMIPKQIFEIVKRINDEENPTKKEKYKKEFMKDPKLKSSFEYILSMTGKSEEDELIKHVTFRFNEIQKRLDSIKKGEIEISGAFLKEFGFLDKFIYQQNKDYKLLGIPELQYKLVGQGNEIGLEDIFKEDFLNKLTTEQLTILNTFWQNRFTKNVEQIAEGLFIYDNLKYWDKLKKGEEKEPVDDETLLNILYKSQICKRIYNRLVQDATFESNGDICFSIIDLGKINSDFRTEYHNYFRNSIHNSKNDIISDIKSQDILRNQILLIYREKEDMLSETLINIEYSKVIKNWGYIPEKFRGKNSIENGRKNILIGIDYPGFNMPLRLHIPKEKMLDFIKNVKGTTIIPIYNGAEDMNRSDGSNITTKVFMPLTPETESAIIKKNKTMKSTDTNYKFFAHIGTLVTKKVKCIKPIKATEYINIETGKKTNLQGNLER